MLPVSPLGRLPAFHPGLEFFLSCSGICPSCCSLSAKGQPPCAERICPLLYLRGDCFQRFNCSSLGEPERERERKKPCDNCLTLKPKCKSSLKLSHLWSEQSPSKSFWLWSGHQPCVCPERAPERHCSDFNFGAPVRRHLYSFGWDTQAWARISVTSSCQTTLNPPGFCLGCDYHSWLPSSGSAGQGQSWLIMAGIASVSALRGKVDWNWLVWVALLIYLSIGQLLAGAIGVTELQDWGQRHTRPLEALIRNHWITTFTHVDWSKVM